MGEGRQYIYGHQPVTEAQRGRRRVYRVFKSPETSGRRLEEMAGSPDHQGIVAEVEAYPYGNAAELLDPAEGLIVVLDQIQDPHNLGAVCRSAEVAGASAIVIPDRRAASVTASVCKASAGAVEHLNIARVTNIADWIDDAKKAGFWVWGADGTAEATPWSVDLTGPTVLVLGTEGKGLRPRVAGSCDGLVAIPQRGNIDSLNVSVAAAVLLFEAVRQRS